VLGGEGTKGVDGYWRHSKLRLQGSRPSSRGGEKRERVSLLPRKKRAKGVSSFCVKKGGRRIPPAYLFFRVR